MRGGARRGIVRTGDPGLDSGTQRMDQRCSLAVRGGCRTRGGNGATLALDGGIHLTQRGVDQHLKVTPTMLETVEIGADGADFQRQTVEHRGLRRQAAITDIIDMLLGDLDQSRQTFLAQYPGCALNLGQQPRHVLEQGRARRVFNEAFDGLLDRAEVNVSLVGDDAEQLLVIRFG